MVVDAAKIPQVLSSEAKGVLLNLMGINLPLPIRRKTPAGAAGAAASGQAPADTASPKENGTEEKAPAEEKQQ